MFIEKDFQKAQLSKNFGRCYIEIVNILNTIHEFTFVMLENMH